MRDEAMEAVRHRFSHAAAADRWNTMYAAGGSGGERHALEDFHFRERRDLAVDLVLASAAPGAMVLDLGCGSGPVLAELRRHGRCVLGMDYSEDMLEHARSRLRAVGLDDGGLMQGDCRATPYPDAHFDVVVCLGVISYIEDYAPAIAEMHRLLKPGGLLLVSFRNVFNPVFFDPVALARRVLRTMLAPLLGRRVAAGFEIGRFLDHRDVARCVEAHGFCCTDFHGIGYGPFRFAGRALFSEQRAIRISRFLGQLCTRHALHGAQRWLADVGLLVCRKLEGAGKFGATRANRCGSR